MKAQELLQKYAMGDRNFQGVSLQGENLSGQQLSGIDFSRADIRGTNFCDATLQGVNFSQAIGGVQSRWLTLQVTIGFFLAMLAGFFQGLAITFIPTFFDGTTAGALSGWLAQAFFLGVLATVSWWGLTGKSVGVASVGAIATLVLAMSVEPSFDLPSEASVSGPLLVALPLTLILIFATVTVFAGMTACLNKVPAIALSCLMGFIAIYTAVDMPRMEGVNELFLFLGAVDISLALGVSSYAAWCALKGDSRFAIARHFGLALSTMGGTRFEGADLTKATFHQAQLKNTRFHSSSLRSTIVKHTAWQGAEDLDGAKVVGTILADARVRSLLTTPESGYKADLRYADLRGANLNGVTLEGADLRQAILTDALLTNTMLKDAALSEAQAAGADFSHAYMTGAILDEWKIDVYTQFDHVECLYFFLSEKQDQSGARYRQPKDEHQVFQPGEFAQRLDKLFDRSPYLPPASSVPAKMTGQVPSVPMAQPTQYAPAQPATLEGSTAAAEQARQMQAQREAELIKTAEEMKALAFLMAKQPINVHNENRNHIVTNDQSRHIHVGGNFSIAANNSVVNLGEIGGELKNQIAQIGQSEPQEQLRALLSELQVAIEEEPLLSEEEKAEALEEVKELAIAGQDPEDSKFKKMAKRSLNALKGMALGMTTTAALLPAYNRLLPEIATLLGL